MDRCVNCGIANGRCNFLRRRALDDETILSVIRRWLAPQPVNSSEYICQACWDLVRRLPVDAPRQFGHRSVCVNCGCALASKVSHLLHTDSIREFKIYSVIKKWIKPQTVEVASRICHCCWVKADRAAVSGPSTFSQKSYPGKIQSQTQDLPIQHPNTKVKPEPAIVLPDYMRAMEIQSNIKKLVAELSRDFDVTVDKEKSASLIKEDSIHLSSEEEETPFSWQKTTCIPYDTDEVGASENDIHLYDSSPQEFEAAQLKHTERPSSGVLEELKCNLCERTITGPFRYSCVQCYDFDLCGACEARGAHHMHYVLRAPGHKTISEVQSLIRAIRQALTAAEPIAPISVDSDELKTEIKEEAGERLVPVNDDDDPLSLNVKPEETTDDESTDSYSTLSVNEEEPFPKRPALSPKNVSHSTPSISEEPSPKRHAFSTKNVSHSTPTISEKPCPKRPALSPKNVSHSTPSISEEPSPKRRALSPKNVSHKTKQTITPSASTSKITQGVAACTNNPPVLQLKPIDNLRINVPISAKPPIITLHQRMNNFSSKGRPLILRQIKTYPGKKQYSPLIGSHVNVSGKPPHLGERPVVSQPGTVGSQMLGNIFKK
ncbi:uncharacterized protein LOC113240316 [Hyposmocoma kahamanoa]|uniref:uncharacterized protein LOC113240316 n=1 Tax=Hyposmocoma kahamanoa TaxID=1477025 RepID=UPI000E6D7738|nr:uncharacterized protein LOC113240316 [Hyposmocoma kahamanoa]